MFRRQRLDSEQIEGAAGDHSILNHCYWIIEPGRVAPSDIDEIACRLHQLKLRGVSYSFGFGRVWNGYDHQIVLRKQRVERIRLVLVVRRNVVFPTGLDGEHLLDEVGAQFGCLLTDSADPDDQCCRCCQIDVGVLMSLHVPPPLSRFRNSQLYQVLWLTPKATCFRR